MKPPLAEAKHHLRPINTMQKGLLVCGIFSSLLFIFADILASVQSGNYSYTSQNTSELFATNAPTRTLLVSCYTAYNFLVILFGVGLATLHGQKRVLRLAGILLIGYALAGEVRLLFFPMHSTGEERAISDNMNIIFTGFVVLFILLAIGYGASTFGKRFRSYSIGTIVVLILFAIATSINNTRIEEHLPTPWLGIMERVFYYGSLLWISVLSVFLLRGGGRSHANSNND